MPESKVIIRLNELYHLSKLKPLNETELAERDRLRREYLEFIKDQVKASLDQVEVVDASGNPVKCTHDHGDDHHN